MNTKSVDLIIIGCEEGDWEGLYVGDILFTENYSIALHDWVELIKVYRNFSGNVKGFEFTAEQMDELGCNFPKNINDIPQYFFQESSE